MFCVWARHLAATAAAAACIALAACGAGDGVDLSERERAASYWMESNGRRTEIVTLDSGLQYRVLREGAADAPSPDSNDLVRVNYEGSLIDGTVFDSSYVRGTPYVTTPEQVVPGWTEALQRMKVGDEWLLYVPPSLGYGARGAPPDIPPHAILVFRIELLDIAPAAGGSRVDSARG